MKKVKVWLLIVGAIFAGLATILTTPKVYADDQACETAEFYDPLICGGEYPDEELELIRRVRDTLNVVYLWVGIIAVIVIIIAGINFMISRGQADKVKRARDAILYAVIGLIVTLAAFAITGLVINALEGQAVSKYSGGGGGSGGSGNSPFGDDRKEVRDIAVNAKEVTLHPGNEYTLKTKIIPNYATDKTIKYSIDKPGIASIEQSGVIRGKKEGEAIVTISTPSGIEKTVKIHVLKPIAVERIKLSKNEVTLKKNQTTTVTATPVPTNAADKTIIWKSKNSKIATVSQYGTIKAIDYGNTGVVAIARNQPVFAYESPNKITLAATQVTAELPTVEAEVKVKVGSDHYACTNSTANTAYKGNLKLRKISMDLLTPHLKDFTWSNESTVINSKGGYTNYIKSLGGIYTMYAGNDKKINIKSACDWQVAAEYTFGLFTLWGTDYDNGDYYGLWGQDTNDQSDAFWQGWPGRGHAGSGYGSRSIDENLTDSEQKRRRTNCNYAADALIKKTTLQHYLSDDRDGGQKIYRTDQLQVGDLLQFFHGCSESGWGHVAVVGEVYRDYIVTYDGGRRFIHSKQYKYKIKRGGASEMISNGSPYDNYDCWYAVRRWNFDQSKVLEGLNESR